MLEPYYYCEWNQTLYTYDEFIESKLLNIEFLYIGEFKNRDEAAMYLKLRGKSIKREKKYILTIKAKRKNSKKHIVERGSYEKCMELAANMNNDYIVELWTGNWGFIKRIEREDTEK